MCDMSKSTTDFSAFDFNDSSDNTDDETPAPFLSRSTLNNHNNSNNNKNCGSNGSSDSGNSVKRKNSNTTKNTNNNVKGKNSTNTNKKINKNNNKSRRTNQLSNDCDHLISSTSNSSNSNSNEEVDEGDNNDNGEDGRTNELSALQEQRLLRQKQQKQQKQQKREQLQEPVNGHRSLNERNNCNNICGVGVEDIKGDVDDNVNNVDGDDDDDGDNGGNDDDESDGEGDSDVDDDEYGKDDDNGDNGDCVERESGGEKHCMSQQNVNNNTSKTQPTHKHNSDVLLMAALNASTEMNNRRNVAGAIIQSRTIQSTTITTTTIAATIATTTKFSTKVEAITNSISTSAAHSNGFSRNSSPAANSIDSDQHLGACSEDDGDGIGIGIGVSVSVNGDGDGDGGVDGTNNACTGESQMHNGHSKQIASLLDNGHNNNNNNNSNNNNNNARLNACSMKNIQSSMNNINNNSNNDCNELRRSSSSASFSNHSHQTANHAGGSVSANINIGMNVGGGDGEGGESGESGESGEDGNGGGAVSLDNAVSRSALERVGGNSNGGGSNNNMARIHSSGSLCGGGGTVSASASISSISVSNFNVSGERKKYRHQNYSKNIYIGTKNAEKWEHMRTRLHFKNDVEFVVYLLNMAENDTERLANLPSISVSTTPTKGFDGNFKLEPNLSAKEFGIVSNCSSVGGGSAGGGSAGSNSQTGENVTDIQPTPQAPPVKRKYKKRVQFNDPLNGAVTGKTKNISNMTVKAKKQMMTNKSNSSGNKNSNNNNTNNNVSPNKKIGNGTEILPEVLDCRIAEKIKSELEEKSASIDSLPNALCLKKSDPLSFGGVSANGSAVADGDDEDDDDGGNFSIIGESIPDGITINNNQNSKFRNRSKGNKRGPKPMVPPTPSAADNDDDPFFSDDDDVEDDDPLDEEALAREMKNEQNFVEEEDELDIALRSQQSCKECSLTHDYKICPLRTAIGTITDAVDLAEWIERKNLEALAKLKADAQRQAKQLHGDDDEDMDESSQLSELETKPLITFAEASVPAEFELHNVEPNVTGVFARTDVRAFSKLGPLIGQLVKSTDIREGSDMKWIFEICEAGAEKSQFLLCDNPNSSNWLRYIRPAPNYDERNVNLVSIESQAFFVTCRELKNGMELLYWSDDCNTMWRKKHWSEKTNCGGCNLKFDHSLYYRTHCSIFHDPSMSLTIRKYHCKVCGEAVLGRDNILKHAAEKHDGTGAHQCQFCNKYFLRLNYLDVHRTYGCAANPNRCQPICDLCGRKFFRPQKLNTHMKRMHSDMADVLRDFQCKLCSKLLGSRAALQRHAKEVHSRNSTVVSCPRCSKLFQNRSNLKIHMLTHSGVRPFKCSEAECNAAFTTKQCLQFHYKKVHNYTQEQMPKIERSVAYTFDAYSGGMKVDFLEQAPRRRRKSFEDHNSVMSSSLQSDTEFSDDNIFEVIKKSGKSIKDLCRNEPNLSLLSSKISNIFGEKPAPKKRGRKRKDHHLLNDRENEHDHVEQIRRKQNAQLSLVETFLTTTAQRLTAQQQVQQVVAAAAAVSAMASGASDDPNKLHMMPGLQHQHMALTHQHSISSMVHDEEEEDDEEADDEQSHHPHESVGEQISHDESSYRHTTGMNALGQNLVVSKGSKKWISDDDHQISRDCASVDRCALAVAPIVSGSVNANLTGNSTGSCSMNQTGDLGIPSFAVPSSASDDSNKLIGNNRDFLSRLINSANSNHNHHVGNTREEDENTSFLDVVEPNNNNNNNTNNNNSNNNGANNSMSQYHHNNNANSVNTTGGSNSAGSNSGATNVSTSMTHNSEHDSVHGTDDQDPINSLTHPQSFMSTFYNNANTRLSNTATGSSSSASMLVEAALNSVGNMIDSDNNELKVPTENNINTDSPLSSHVDTGAARFNTNNAMDNLESELKMMKNLNNFPMQMPPLPMFSNTNNNLSSCNISPNNSTSTNPHSQQNNEVDVDAGSTPRPQHLGGGGVSGTSGGATEADGYAPATQHRTPTSPQPISPGRDYGMFNNNMNNGTSGGPGTGGSTGSAHSTGGSSNNISGSSPLPPSMAQVQRRAASTVSSSYPEHELISPASSPSIPRYNFNSGDVLRHKHRVGQELDRRQILAVGHNAISSDEENSIMPQNSSAGQDMRMKFSQPQIDLMYSKYESLANSAVLKYNNQSMDSPTEYRNTNSVAATANATNDISDLQGLDMSSRSNLNTSNYHHNFQLPSNTPANLSGIGRYHHHIYDILSEREQNQGNQGQNQQQLQHHQQQQQQEQHHHHHHNTAAQHQQQEHASQLTMQQHQSAMHGMLTDQMNEQEHDQVATVDLSRTANYVVPSPPQLPYNHPHHDMIRMASLDLTPNTNMSVGNNRSFLSSQMQHQSRESLEHHRLLSTVEQHRILAASNAADQHRLLVDPTAHLLMEQNNRLLGSDQSRLLGETAQNRHMAAARGFGAYHQVASGNYHHSVRPTVLPSSNHHASNPSNYHPFPAYY